jgi:hypothetical protein
MSRNNISIVPHQTSAALYSRAGTNDVGLSPLLQVENPRLAS